MISKNFTSCLMTMVMSPALFAECPVELSPVTAPSGYAIDHRAIDTSNTAIPSEYLDKARQLTVAVAHPPGADALVTGLEELAVDTPRYAYRGQKTTDAGWYAKGGGIGHFGVGTGKDPTKRIDGFSQAISGPDRAPSLGGNLNVAYMKLASSDLPSGNKVEIIHTTHRVTMEVNATHAAMEGALIENIMAPRVISTPGGTLVGPSVPYPIELPNVGLSSVHTMCMVPAGDTIEVRKAHVSPRDPRLAFTKYRDAMQALEAANPKTTFVWSTVPLATDANLQRNYFNLSVRQYCRANGKVLYDIAAIQSHDENDNVQADQQGEKLHSAYARNPRGSDMNAVGRQRLAKAWWWMLARIGGWSGKTS
jgi:hypothetical protein